ncbi:(deoxy)nucleoside triphosphate pyrophosphohydrolase [Streptomyces sp. NPDC050560]|uniref:(deoxy)nucleoside triphosphate pyrophosphohydrolase n=1 Tax=Streptomyces sp. NPDC050560 TaxID=3365630 RepID=UPI00379A6892
MTERLVVGGAVWAEGRLLAARRSAPPELAGRWELPGGKVEPGEAPESALMRELTEELGIETLPMARVPGQWPVGAGRTLQVWVVSLLAGKPEPLQDHDEVRWLEPDAIWDVDWLPGDVPAVRETLRVLRLPDPAATATAPTATAAATAPTVTATDPAAGRGAGPAQ